MLAGPGVDEKDMRMIRKLYYQQMVVVKVGNVLTEFVDIKRGARRGCVLSPDLFTLYGEIILREIEEMDGFRVGGQNINNFRFAYDTVHVADSVEKL